MAVLYHIFGLLSFISLKKSSYFFDKRFFWGRWRCFLLHIKIIPVFFLIIIHPVFYGTGHPGGFAFFDILVALIALFFMG